MKYTTLIRTAAFAVTVMMMAIPAAAQLRPVDEATLAEIEKTKDARVATAIDNLTASRERYGLDPNSTFEAQAASVDQFGQTSARFVQRYRGVRVEGAGGVLHIAADGSVLTPVAKLFGPAIDIVPQLTPEQILEIVRQRMPRSNLDEKNVKIELLIRPQLELVRVKDAAPGSNGEGVGTDYEYRVRTYKLAYRAAAASDEEPGRVFFIDALTGEILDESDLEVSAEGTGYYNKDAHFNVSTYLGDFILVDGIRNIEVWNNKENKGKSSVWADYYYDGDNVWGDGKAFVPGSDTKTTRGQTAGVDIMVNMSATYDMLKALFGRNSFDGHGGKTVGRAHYEEGYTDAFFSPDTENVYLGDGNPDPDPKVHVEPRYGILTIAHELGHKVLHHELGGTPTSMEGRGINEGQGDIQGFLGAVYQRNPGPHLNDIPDDWSLMSSRMRDPLSYQRKGWTGLKYWSTNVTKAEEHTIGCLYGHFFAILTRGASSDPADPLYSKYFPVGLPPLDLNIAASLWYRVTTHYMPAEPTHQDLFDSWKKAADDYYDKNDPVYKAVQYAWMAVGMTDGIGIGQGTNPKVQVSIQKVDEADGSALVRLIPSDDHAIQKVSLRLGSHAVSEIRNSIGASGNFFDRYMDIIGFATGTHVASGEAYDFFGNKGEGNANALIKGVQDLVANGGFESGLTGWTDSGSNIGNYEDTGNGFGGSNRYASSLVSGTVSQDVTIPSNISAAMLSFRVAVLKFDGDNLSRKMRVEVQAAGGSPETVANFTAGSPTDSKASANYVRYTYDVLKHKGKKMTIRMVFDGAGPNKIFRVDNVRLTVDGPKAAVLAVDAHAGERTVSFMLKSLSNVTLAQVGRVDYYVDNSFFVSIADPNNPEALLVREMGEFTNKGHVAGARIYDQEGNHLVDSQGVAFNVSDPNNLIANGDFELGKVSWLGTANPGVRKHFIDPDSFHPAFSGEWHADMGHTGAALETLYQNVGIPVVAESAKLSFRLRIESDEPNKPTNFDVLDAKLIILSTNEFAHVIGDAYNTPTWGPEYKLGYRRFEINVPKHFIGKNLRLQFESKQGGGASTRFYIDRVALTYELPDKLN